MDKFIEILLSRRCINFILFILIFFITATVQHIIYRYEITVNNSIMTSPLHKIIGSQNVSKTFSDIIHFNISIKTVFISACNSFLILMANQIYFKFMSLISSKAIKGTISSYFKSVEHFSSEHSKRFDLNYNTFILKILLSTTIITSSLISLSIYHFDYIANDLVILFALATIFLSIHIYIVIFILRYVIPSLVIERNTTLTHKDIYLFLRDIV